MEIGEHPYGAPEMETLSNVVSEVIFRRAVLLRGQEWDAILHKFTDKKIKQETLGKATGLPSTTPRGPNDYFSKKQVASVSFS